MARVKFSPIVTDIAGSVGGVTFQRNKFGNTMREKPLPLNPATSAQYNVRQKMITIQQAWQDLTDAQRLQWKRFLDYSGQSINRNRSIKLSGHALYIKYQMYRLLTGMSLLTVLSYVPMPEVPVISYVKTEPDSLQLQFSDVCDHTEIFFLFFITSPRHASRASSKAGLLFMSIPVSSQLMYQFKTAYIDSFGVLPPVGSVVHYSLKFFSVLAPVYTGTIFGKITVTAV